MKRISEIFLVMAMVMVLSTSIVPHHHHSYMDQICFESDFDSDCDDCETDDDCHVIQSCYTVSNNKSVASECCLYICRVHRSDILEEDSATVFFELRQDDIPDPPMPSSLVLRGPPFCIC